MAQGQVTSAYGLVDKRRGRVQVGANPHTEKGNLDSVNAMRTRLAALNPTYSTAAKLDAMTVNDMVFALKDSASV
jgi:hypothetical protein